MSIVQMGFSNGLSDGLIDWLVRNHTSKIPPSTCGWNLRCRYGPHLRFWATKIVQLVIRVAQEKFVFLTTSTFFFLRFLELYRDILKVDHPFSLFWTRIARHFVEQEKGFKSILPIGSWTDFFGRLFLLFGSPSSSFFPPQWPPAFPPIFSHYLPHVSRFRIFHRWIKR